MEYLLIAMSMTLVSNYSFNNIVSKLITNTCVLEVSLTRFMKPDLAQWLEDATAVTNQNVKVLPRDSREENEYAFQAAFLNSVMDPRARQSGAGSMHTD